MKAQLRAARNRSRSAAGALRAWWLRRVAGIKDAWDEPPVDLLTAGMLGLLIGRVYLYVSLIVSAVTGAMWAVVCVLLFALLVDVTVHAFSIKAMVDYMRKMVAGLMFTSDETVFGSMIRDLRSSMTAKGGSTVAASDMVR